MQDKKNFIKNFGGILWRISEGISDETREKNSRKNAIETLGEIF